MKSESLIFFSLGLCCCVLPVVMSKHGAVTVTEVQPPDLHVPVGRAGGDDGVILVGQKDEVSQGGGATG